MIKTKPSRPKPTKKTLKTLLRVISIFGGENKDLARALGVSDVIVSRWKMGKSPVSIRCAYIIEKKTKGAIKAIDLIPDFD